MAGRMALLGIIIALSAANFPAGATAAGQQQAAPILRPQLELEPGEIRLDGTVQSVDLSRSALTVAVLFWRDSHRLVQLEPNPLQTVTITPATLISSFQSAGETIAPNAITPGCAVSAVGPAPASGAALPARRVAVKFPPPGVPLRGSAWIGGDSLAKEPGDILLAVLRRNHIRTSLDFHVSSGLCTPTFFNWFDRFQAAMAEHHPAVVVVIMGANDGRLLGYQSPRRQMVYSDRVARAMDILDDGKRLVVWSGMPVMREHELSKNMALVNWFFWEQAALHNRVIYVDSWGILADSHGRYVERTARGSILRAPDGIHFDGAGARRVAAVVYSLFASQLQPEEKPSLPADNTASASHSPSRIIVDAVLLQAPAAPTLRSIAPYRNALVAYRYRVVRVVQGQCEAREILAAVWAIRNGVTVLRADTNGRRYRLTLEPISNHPEIQSQTIVQDSRDLKTPLYYAAIPPRLLRLRRITHAR